MKYPNLPKIDAVSSWSDDKRQKGTITNHLTFKRQERVVDILMVLVKEKTVETRSIIKIIRMLRQDFYIDLIQL